MEIIIFSFFIMIFAHNLNKKLLIENLALRQQLMVMRLTVKRPKIRKRDRLFWVILSHLWKGWKNPLVFVQPETVIRWHRKGFMLFWTLKSRKNRTGRPPVDSKTRQLIKDMASANQLWGAPRIHGELLKLGIDVSEPTISEILNKARTHLGLNKDTPSVRPVPEGPENGKVKAFPRLGSLHHRYEWQEAA